MKINREVFLKYLNSIFCDGLVEVVILEQNLSFTLEQPPGDSEIIMSGIYPGKVQGSQLSIGDLNLFRTIIRKLQAKQEEISLIKKENRISITAQEGKYLYLLADIDYADNRVKGKRKKILLQGSTEKAPRLLLSNEQKQNIIKSIEILNPSEIMIETEQNKLLISIGTEQEHQCKIEIKQRKKMRKIEPLIYNPRHISGILKNNDLIKLRILKSGVLHIIGDYVEYFLASLVVDDEI